MVYFEYAKHYCEWCHMGFSELEMAKMHEQDCEFKQNLVEKEDDILEG